MTEKEKWSDVLSDAMCAEARRMPDLYVVTAAISDNTGLKGFRDMFPDRYYDTGAAVQYAVTFGAGLARDGRVPVFAVRADFLQRAFDQIVREVCLKALHMVFVVEQAGLTDTGEETRRGVYDLSFLNMMPNLYVLTPKNRQELADMLHWAVREADGPAAIRCPAGMAYEGLEEFRAPVEAGKWEILYDETDICLLASGSMVETAVEVRNMLKHNGANCSLINCRFVKPLDTEVLMQAAREHDLIVTMEENAASGGFGDAVLVWLNAVGCSIPVEHIALPDEYLEPGTVDMLRKETATDAVSICRRIEARRIGLERRGESTLDA